MDVFILTELYLQRCILIVHDYSCDTNTPVINITVKIFNDFVRDSVIDVTYDLKAKLFKATIYLEFKIPGIDGFYGGSTPLKSSIDVEKVLNGVNGNVLFRTVMDGFLKSLDFTPKFPVNPVSKFLCSHCFE